jgi:hypothetical protein
MVFKINFVIKITKVIQFNYLFVYVLSSVARGQLQIQNEDKKQHQYDYTGRGGTPINRELKKYRSPGVVDI